MGGGSGEEGVDVGGGVGFWRGGGAAAAAAAGVVARGGVGVVVVVVEAGEEGCDAGAREGADGCGGDEEAWWGHFCGGYCRGEDERAREGERA